MVKTVKKKRTVVQKRARRTTPPSASEHRAPTAAHARNNASSSSTTAAKSPNSSASVTQPIQARTNAMQNAQIPLMNDDFFRQTHVTRDGIAVRGAAACQSVAIDKCVRWIDQMLEHQPNAAKRLRESNAQFHVIAESHPCSELPYLRRFRDTRQDGMTWDERNRGTAHKRWASGGEEGILDLKSDRYYRRRAPGAICVHEFAHTLQQCGFAARTRAVLRARYLRATSEGLWATAYAATNEDEFFAELCMWFFGLRGDFGRILPTPRAGKEWLKQYDPTSFALLQRIFSGEFDNTADMHFTRTLTPSLSPMYEFDVHKQKSIIAANELVPIEQPASPSTSPESGDESPSPPPPSAPATRGDEPFEWNAEREWYTKHKVHMIIYNCTPELLSIYWLDPNHRRQPRGIVHPNDSSEYCTFPGDPFLLANAKTGQGVAMFIPTRDSPLQAAVVYDEHVPRLPSLQ